MKTNLEKIDHHRRYILGAAAMATAGLAGGAK